MDGLPVQGSCHRSVACISKRDANEGSNHQGSPAGKGLSSRHLSTHTLSHAYPTYLVSQLPPLSRAPSFHMSNRIPFRFSVNQCLPGAPPPGTRVPQRCRGRCTSRAVAVAATVAARRFGWKHSCAPQPARVPQRPHSATSPWLALLWLRLRDWALAQVRVLWEASLVSP